MNAKRLLPIHLVIASCLVAATVGAVLLSGCRLLPTGGDSSGRSTPSGGTVPRTTCPLDGMPASEAAISRRPLAVMIENSPKARPQTGLDQACVVYEGLTEGGITRFMAIYLHNDPAVIGPVRSARPHFIYLAQEYQAPLVHCGESLEALVVFNDNPSILNLDQMKYLRPFWRDKTRRAPHNLYASSAKLRQEIARLGWEGSVLETPEFTGAARMPETAAAAPRALLNFNGAVHYRLQLVYDPELGGYQRYMDGKLHVDRLTGKPLVAQNVIIQWVLSQPNPDSKVGTQDVQVVGSGDGIFLTGGRQLPIRWTKSYTTAITRYEDSTGRVLPFQPGQTWIELLPTTGSLQIAGTGADGENR